MSLSLDTVVRIYIRKFRPRAHAELDWFREQSSLRAAIEKAAYAINSKGKRYSHQRRLRKTTLGQAHSVLQANAGAFAEAIEFDALHRLIHTLLKPIAGIGELYVYDTSLRIGAKLSTLPTKVYLHAGTRLGARALGLHVRNGLLEVSTLPPVFRSLAAYEIEDVLCIFKDELGPASAKPRADDIIKRSWCG